MHIIVFYLGVLAGIFLEGEMVMISSVIAAHHGYLNLWIVIGTGVTGTYLSDCFYFFLGRKRGVKWIEKQENLKKRVAVVDARLVRNKFLVFIVYRFMYGFRMVTPLVLGAGKTKTVNFLFLSAITTVIWAAVYTSMGYLFGELIESQLSHIEHIEKYIIGGFIFIALALILHSVINGKIRRNH